MELEIMKLEALLEHKRKQYDGLRKRFDKERAKTRALAAQVQYRDTTILRTAMKVGEIFDRTSMKLALEGELGEYKRGYYAACQRVADILKDETEHDILR
jgi:hypothetical protein